MTLKQRPATQTVPEKVNADLAGTRLPLVCARCGCAACSGEHAAQKLAFRLPFAGDAFRGPGAKARSVTFAQNLAAALADEEIEVRAPVGLQHRVVIEFVVAAVPFLFGRLPGRHAGRQFFLADE